MVELSLNLRETKDDLMNLDETKLHDLDGGDRAANPRCSPKSATSVKFVHRVHPFTVLVTGSQGTMGLEAHSCHTATYPRPQNEKRMEYTNALLGSSFSDHQLQCLEGNFLKETPINSVNAIKSIIEGNLSKDVSDSAFNSVHET